MNKNQMDTEDITSSLWLWNMFKPYSHSVGFHMPGHNAGLNTIKNYAAKIVSLDTTELSCTDDLHNPKGPGLEAMKRVAKIYGSQATVFVTTGSSTAIKVAIASVLNGGNFFLIPRTVHMSVVYGFLLLDCKFAFIPSPISPSKTTNAVGLIPTLKEADLEKALEMYPQTTDVLLVSPDYYGHILDIKKISRLCHAKKCRLLIDEAHGAHLSFTSGTLDGISNGADLVIQSLHKTLPALTMASQIHISKTCVAKEKIESKIWQMLRVWETSSPSFVIAASIEFAVVWMEKYGARQIKRQAEQILLLQNKLKAMNTKPIVQLFCTMDPLRFVLKSVSNQLSSMELAEKLENQAVFCEMKDINSLLFMVSPWQEEVDFLKLYEALKYIVTQNLKATSFENTLNQEFNVVQKWRQLMVNIPPLVKSGRKTLLSYYPTKSVKLIYAAGYSMADMIVPYPPGVPLLWPGEEINQKYIDLLLVLLERKIDIIGIKISQEVTEDCKSSYEIEVIEKS